MRLSRFLLPGLLCVLLFTLPGMPARVVHGTLTQPSLVRIDPIATSRGLYSTFGVNVTAVLAPGESISGFDVRINYTNPYTASNPGSVLQAISLNYQSSIFSAFSPSVLVNCIDGIAASQTNGCPSDDSKLPGQVHLTIGTSTGQTVSTGGLLFEIAFKVWGMGSSIFTIDRANLVNPRPDPSNPQVINPVYIPVITQDAVFGNANIVPFFNFQPHDTSVSPSVLPNQRVDFDASASFEENNPSPGFWRYSWNFGDGGMLANYSVPTVPGGHLFALPGNYSVALTVYDATNRTGTVYRSVDVKPALGGLTLTVKDQGGNTIVGAVVVKLFNSSSSGAPFATRTIDSTTGLVQFVRLAPSDGYYLTFSGSSVENVSKTESVSPGWTTLDRVYLQLNPAPADYSGIIYIVSILAGLGLVTGAIVYKTRTSREGSPRRSARGVAGRVSGKS